MIKKILLSLIIITTSSQSGEFINSQWSFKVASGYAAINETHGIYLGLGIEKQLKKTMIEVGILPKFYFSPLHELNHVPGEDVNLNDLSFQNVNKYSYYKREVGVETSFLFSPRPPIRVKKNNGSFTFSLWRYGLVLELGLYGKNTYLIDDKTIQTSTSYMRNNKIIGILYKPSFGIQISNILNISLELQYSFNLGGSAINPSFKYGGGLVLIFSDFVNQ